MTCDLRRRSFNLPVATAMIGALLGGCGGRTLDSGGDALSNNSGAPSPASGNPQSGKAGMAGTNTEAGASAGGAPDDAGATVVPRGGCDGSVCDPPPKSVPLSAGALHTCGITAGGGLKCWGDNSYGQLGAGTTARQSVVPVDVIGLTSGVAAVSAGVSHTCALTDQGAAKCWGDNGVGELGNDSFASSSVPVDVVGLSSAVAAISAGYQHTCAITRSGSVQCWGNGSHGQLGNSSSLNKSVPVDVQGLPSAIVSVSAGTYHTCVVTAGGGVLYWGDSSFGELGQLSPMVSSSLVPTAVAGAPSGAVAVTATEVHSCVLTAAGTMACWGDNLFGDLGDGTTTSTSVPVEVSGLTASAVAFAVGENHTCAVTEGGAASCWGDNVFGQLGDGTTMNSDRPVPVVGLGSGVVSIAAGWGGDFPSWSTNGGNRHTCAMTQAHGVKCWGSNDSGQLGTMASGLGPRDVVGF